MTDKPRICVGLHITKCAGTALATSLRRVLTEDQYCFYSSYYENFLANRPLFSEIRSHERLLLYFGHYCHENLLRVFGDRDIYLFTGLREPVSRALSDFRQLNAANAFAGRPPVGPDQYLESQSNSMCAEILRCFPTLAERPGKAAWENARDALSMMDFIYSTANFQVDAQEILKALGLDARHRLMTDNVSDTRDEAQDVKDGSAALKAQIERDPERWFGGDLRLYEAIEPYLGRANLRAVLAAEDWAIDRDEYVSRLPPKDEALVELAALERDYLVNEFHLLGMLDRLRDALRGDIARREQILARIAEFDPERAG